MLICFGSPLIDIIVQVKNHFLMKYNIESDKAIRAELRHEKLFKEILAFNPSYLPGGSITNTARIVKWISNDQYVIFVGSIGNDIYGKKIVSQLKNDEVECYLVTTDSDETGKCAVLISDNGKHRSLITNLGASKMFSTKELQDYILQEKMRQSMFVYISTFFFGISVEATKSIVDYFKEPNKKIIVNLGACFIINKYPASTKYLYQNADVIIGNEKEFLCLAAISNIENFHNLEGSVEEIENIYSSRFNRLILVTRASEPILVYHNKLFKYFNVESVENIIDTNGAGDAFVGGFLAKYIKGEPLEDCVKCGIWCAQTIIQCIGCDFDKQISYNG